MNKKAQVFSIDFILSIVLVMLALGLIVQITELNAYNAKENRMQGFLERIAFTASQNVISIPETTCELVDFMYSLPLDRNEFMINCIDTAKAATTTPTIKERLGIPSYVDCRITYLMPGTATEVAMPVTNCIATQLPTDKRNVIGIERAIVVHDGSLRKDELETCKKNPADLVPGEVVPEGETPCTLENTVLRVFVWK